MSHIVMAGVAGKNSSEVVLSFAQITKANEGLLQQAAASVCIIAGGAYHVSSLGAHVPCERQWQARREGTCRPRQSELPPLEHIGSDQSHARKEPRESEDCQAYEYSSRSA